MIFCRWSLAAQREMFCSRWTGNLGTLTDDASVAQRPFFKKSETFHRPPPDLEQEHSLFQDVDAMGTDGPIHVSFNREFTLSHRLWHETLTNAGVPTNRRHMAGSNVGAWAVHLSVEPETWTRSYSGNSYLPLAKNGNLFLLTNATVTEIDIQQNVRLGGAGWMATGVNFVHDGGSYCVATGKEVILCAGSFQSPQILERSGVGDPSVLGPAGVNVKVNNANVGSNLQDHLGKLDDHPWTKAQSN
jgi:choline dehydrogenase-like flavoprotein